MRHSRLAPFALLASLAFLPALLPAQQATPAEKTAEQEFKNIQVFQGKPANELIPTMQFMASSLGVSCNFCHAQPFSADTKPEKATARKMIQMVYAINKDNFGGRNQINCYTCHQGHNRPTSALTIAADEPAGAAAPGEGRGPGGPGGRGPGQGAAGQTPGRGPSGPSAQAILDKYTTAIGGASALAAIKSETITSERVSYGQSSPETVLRADGKLAIQGSTKSGFDGTNYWSSGGRGGEVTSDAIGLLQVERALYPGADIKAEGARAFGEQPVGTQTAVVLAVRTPDGAARYYFDKDSGLLLRVVTSTPTFLGGLPLQVDYSDYRTVDSVKLPFDIKVSTHDRMWERKVNDIKLNGTIDQTAFQAPAAKN